MKTFKTYIKERLQDARSIIKQLENGPFDYVDPETDEVNRVYHAHEIEEYLENIWHSRILGAGFYAVAHSGAAKEIVLKILRYEDKNYVKYANISMKNHNSNSIFPNIIKHIAFGKGQRDEPIDIYFMEYIVPAEKLYSSNESVAFLAKEHTLDMLWMAFEANKESPNIIKDEIKKGLTMRGRAFANINFNVDDFLDWCIKMKEAGFNNESSDLHHGNWGLRNDGSLVIFDPVG
jgi:hypothetical protein